MFIKKELFKGLLFAFVLPSCLQVQAFLDQSVKVKQDNLANGLSSYIHDVQVELGQAGPDLLEEHQGESKTFIDDYNAFTSTLSEKTSQPIGLSGDNDCLANLRQIDLDIIPVDPMDILKPIKMQIKDYIEQSPCEMITGTINDEIDKIDYFADSPFGSVVSDSKVAEKKAADAAEKKNKIERKEQVKLLVSDMGSDFKTKVDERRSVVFDDDGTVIKTDDFDVKSTTSNPKTEELVNKEGLLNVWEVFGDYMSSDDSVKPFESSDTTDSQDARAQEKAAADVKAREEALKKSGNGT